MRDVLEALERFGPVLAIKLYRVSLEGAPATPTLPCLDHEAQLHEAVEPHLSVYIQDADTGDLHEVAVTPSLRRVDIDTASTLGEHSEASHKRLVAALRSAFPDCAIKVHLPSRWRAERRVAAACRAQVALREVLLGDDLERLDRRINRLQIIATLMEKQSRVTSWGVRTVTAPVLAAAGVVAYQVLGAFTARLGEGSVLQLRYAVLAVLGAAFLYYGLKAVQLTETANRVWKRAAEYSLIVAGRRRIGPGQIPDPISQADAETRN